MLQPVKYLQLPKGSVIKMVSQSGNTIRVRVESTFTGGYGKVLMVTVLEAPVAYSGQARLVAARIPASANLTVVTQGDIFNGKSDVITVDSVVLIGGNIMRVAAAEIE